MGLFDRKYCDVCGEKIGFLGNRKLEDANLCRKCAAKLSPWFSGRRHTTLEKIREQLAWREENRGRAAAFHTTRSFGNGTRVLLDDDSEWFTVTSAKNLEEANPDILDFADLTGCAVSVDESREEMKKDGPDGKKVSYDPPHYKFFYDFNISVHVNNPYFDTMGFRLNPVRVEGGRSPQYQQYSRQADELCAALDDIIRKKQIPVEEEETEPKRAVVCAYCGASTVPDENGRCEYCGAPALG